MRPEYAYTRAMRPPPAQLRLRTRSFWRSVGAVAMLSFLALPSGGCGPEPAQERGQALASDPRLSPSPSNVFSCTTCHSVTATPADETRTLPGPSLRGALERPSFWGGGLHYVLDAVNQCFVDFMRGTAFSPEDANGRALLAYLRTLDAGSPELAAAVPCTVVRNIDSTYLAQLPVGDPDRGQAAYERACAYCHGRAHTGDGRIGPYVTVIPEDTLSSFGAAMTPAILVEKARHGRYFGIAGAMPFYCREVLSDGMLSDIVAYLLK